MKKTTILCAALLVSLAAPGSSADAGPLERRGSTGETETEETSTEPGQMHELADALTPVPSDDGYRTCYEVFVRSFYDSDGDGIGDLNGVREKLSYISDEMGFDEIWLMPICPSPSYHKYDVTDYEAVDSSYGTPDDYQALVDACHEKNITVITDLVLNHTSSEHPWFTEAADYLRSLPEGEEPDLSECPEVDYYHFSDTAQDGYASLSGTGWYYESRFAETMPDLNLDSEAVRDEIRDIVKFWLDFGTDGFRLDAVTSYYTESSEDTTAFLTWLNSTVKEISPDAYLVGEAWTDQASYAAYYASGVDSFFDFAFSGSEGAVARLARGKMSALKFGNSLMQEEELYASVNPDYINAPFFTNHDMARAAGYFTGSGASAQTKLAGALNLLMQGNAFVYYGEEIGMRGSGKDENKRAPMYWAADGSAEGMCDAPPGMDSFSMTYPSEEEQSQQPWSILNYYRTAIRIRSAFPALKKGTTAVVEELSDSDVCVFIRTKEGEEIPRVLVCLNASEETRTVDLSSDGTAAGFADLAAVLTVNSDPVTLSDGILELPAQSIAFLIP
ncbi:MAG: alpha-amylase family glycosyl hydrolase [Lachnospiraceae bacterium]|jgi:alpha-amylase